jgi:HNH endonuclease/NUMOD4 motif
MNERWMPVAEPGFSIYEVSDHGRVRSVDRTTPYRGSTRFYQGRLLSPSSDFSGNGRQMVLLYSDSDSGLPRRVARKVHHLVLEAFVGPRPEGMEALHWDDDPSNNHLINLRWGTHSENVHDSVRNGTHSSFTRRDRRAS